MRRRLRGRLALFYPQIKHATLLRPISILGVRACQSIVQQNRSLREWRPAVSLRVWISEGPFYHVISTVWIPIFVCSTGKLITLFFLFGDMFFFLGWGLNWFAHRLKSGSFYALWSRFGQTSVMSWRLLAKVLRCRQWNLPVLWRKGGDRGNMRVTRFRRETPLRPPMHWFL